MARSSKSDVKDQFLRWDEPKAILRSEAAITDAKRSRWQKPLLWFFLVCMLMAVWFVAKHNPKKSPPPFETAILGSIAAGFLISHIENVLGMFIPNHVQVREKTLILIRVGSSRIFNYQETATFAIRDFEDYRILVLELQNGRQVVMGMPRDVDVVKLTAFFSERGLKSVP
jgi:hypothetical protein